VAARDGTIATGFEAPGHSGGFELLDRFDPAELADSAARKALAMLDALPSPAGEFPVVLAPGTGGVLILHHPCFDEFDHNFHPSYIEFFNRLLPETRDAEVLREKYEREFANNPSYVEMYRRGNAYHGAHPFFMWYWGENGRQHVGRVIAAGAENAHVPERMGWERADNLTEAISMARSYMGRSAEITMLHQPVIALCEVE
jgi:hypothetical protein